MIARTFMVVLAFAILGACATIDTVAERGATTRIGAEARIDTGPTSADQGQSIVAMVDDPGAATIAALVEESPQVTASRLSVLADRRATVGTAWSSLMPDASANLGADRNNQAIDASDGSLRTENLYTIGFSAGVSPDIWGGATNLLRAARAEAEAAALLSIRETEQTVAHALTVYIQLRAALRSRTIHAERARTLATIESIVEERLANGTALVDELSNARSSRFAAEAEAVAAATKVDLLWLDLDSLLGVPSSELRELLGDHDTVPVVALPNRHETPLEVTRVDLVAADLRARAARYATYSAITEGLPSVRLEAAVFRNDTNVDEVWEARTNWGVTGTVTIPLFAGGNRSATVLAAFSRAQARDEERDYQHYAASVEYVRLVSRDRGLATQLEQLSRALAEAEMTVEAYRRRYLDGTIDVETLLRSQEQAAALRIEVNGLEAAQYINRIALGLAVGLPISSAPVLEKLP